MPFRVIEREGVLAVGITVVVVVLILCQRGCAAVNDAVWVAVAIRICVGTSVEAPGIVNVQGSVVIIVGVGIVTSAVSIGVDPF